jgi:AcrR family transcriptional regulator
MQHSQHTDTKKRILAEAGRLFAEQGYEETSLLQLARAVGVKKASLYYFFKDKEEIFSAVANDLWQRMEEGVKRLSEEGEKGKISPRKYFVDILEMVIACNKEAGNIMTRMEQSARSPANFHKARARITSMRRMLRNFLKSRGVKDPAIAEEVIVNSIQGYVLHNSYCPSPVSVKKYANYIGSLFVK